MRWVILHGYSPPVNHSHLKGSSEGNTDNQGGQEKGKEEARKGNKEWFWYTVQLIDFEAPAANKLHPLTHFSVL